MTSLPQSRFSFRASAALGFLLLVVTLAAQSGPAGGISATTPDRIMLNLTPFPATEMGVAWRTWTQVEEAVVEVAPAVPEVTLAEHARRVAARSEPVKIGDSITVWHHSAIIDGLEPDRLYAYRVGDTTTWSEWNQFRTAKDGPAPFRLLFLGDPQNDILEYCSRAFRAAYAKAPDSAFMLLAGDLVTTSYDDALWGELFAAAGWIYRTLPVLTVPGNHEYPRIPVNGRRLPRQLSPLWRPHFALPDNGLPGLEETSFYVDFQGVRIVGLDGNARLEEQAAWLDRVLADNPNRWTIVMMHQPVYSTGKDRDNPKLREIFLPVYDRHAVDLVLQGHDHSYGRTYKLRFGKRVPDDAPGTVYVVSASGPKAYRTNPEHDALMARLDTGRQLFQVIDIDERRLRYVAWTVTDEKHDEFELRKP